MARHLIDRDGTVEPDVTPESVSKRLDDHTFFWLDMEQATGDDIAVLRDVLQLHELVVEDAEHFGQRPKIEDFDGFTALVVYGATTGEDGLALVEVHAFFSKDYLITVHKGECEVFADLRDHHAKRLARVEEGSGVLYLVVDALVDSFFPRLAELDEQIDSLEDSIFVNPTDDQLQQVFTMKRQLVLLRKTITPQRDMFAALLAGRYDIELTEDASHYFRDVYDHLIRVSDEIDTYRDLLTGAMDVYLSTVSNKLNVIMKQLGVVATIFLPLSFLTGFFGQNFAWLVNRLGGTAVFFGLGVGLEVLAVVFFVAFFKKRGWF